VRDGLAGRRARFVEAPNHDQGLSQSLRSAIEALPEQTLAAIICLGDMPFIPADLLRRMAAAAASDSILVPRFEGRPGNPVLWGKAWFPRLTALSGDAGAKSLLGELAGFVQFIDWDDEGVHIDIDTPDALAAARERMKGNSGT
jgi:CTP:molybdopterin cytidylyltransferase MocA